MQEEEVTIWGVNVIICQRVIASSVSFQEPLIGIFLAGIIIGTIRAGDLLVVGTSSVQDSTSVEISVRKSTSNWRSQACKYDTSI